MSLVSWFRTLPFHRAPALNKAGRQSGRRPPRSRPSVEQLEERTLLDASSGLVAGANNPTFNGAPFSSGVVLPTTPNFPNTTGVTAQEFPSAGAGTALAVTSAFLAQDQATSQFRSFGVNSQGSDNRLVQTNLTIILLDAFGFGSGTVPNSPWVPAAYNVGLANRQFNYSSQSDFGFQPVPPWRYPTAQSIPQDQDVDEELARQMPELLLIHQSTKGYEQDQQEWKGEERRDQNEEMTTLPEKPAEDKQAAPDQAAPDATRGDPAIEEALFTEPLHTLAATALANRLAHAAPRLASANHVLDGSQESAQGPASEDSSIPSALWISAAAPAQMAALVAGLPGAAAPAESCDMGSTAGASE
jgi:hypothetical protein